MITILRFSILSLILLFAYQVSAQLNQNESALAINHLYEVNSQWAKYPDAAPLEKIQFKSDRDRIQYHLFLVEKYLRAHTPEDLVGIRLENRLNLLDALTKYAGEKKFPINTDHSVRQPYFIDDFGTYCAVGHLISVSGHDGLARKVNAEYKYDYLADIKTMGLLDWAVEYGFSADELAWVQPGYPPATPFTAVGTGTDGPVNAIVVDVFNDRLIIAGDFNELNSLPCLNIGSYSSGQLSCLGNGVSGVIHDIFVIGNRVIVAGQIENNGINYAYAEYSGSSWTYFSIPGRSNAIGTAIYSDGSLNNVELAIDYSSLPGKQEIWNFKNNQWILVAEIGGQVFDIETSNLGKVYAGEFESVIAFRTLKPDTSFNANNVAIQEHYLENWFSIGADVPKTVRKIKSIGHALYFGGTCSDLTDESDVCLSRYLNNSLQPLLLKSYFSDTTYSTIHDIQFHDNNSLLLAGKFEIVPLVGVWSKNIASYDLVQNYLISLGVFDKKLTGIAEFDDELILGGHFTKNVIGGGNLPHLAKVGFPQSISPIDREAMLKVFPNPAHKAVSIQLTGQNAASHITLFDLSGKTVKSEIPELSGDTYVMDLDGIASGIYMLNVKIDNQYSLNRMIEVE